MSAHFPTSLAAQPDVQLSASGKPASDPISIIPFAGNGCSEELHPLHSDKTCAIVASGGREIMMRSSSEDADIDGMLDITLHHASDIHNICIYGKQDVYAKFSIIQTQDTVYSTQPVRGGGKNPVFNQSLQILISKLNAVLKCELWMMSCARNYLEDQLLGFVLVPLCDLMGMGRLTRDYSLTSTELFHSPAGTVCLSLMFYKRTAQPLLPAIVSDVGKLNGSENGMGSYVNGVGENGKHEKMSSWTVKGEKGAAVDYNSIEFPDLQVASENQQLVSMYMKMVSGDASMDDISRGGDDSQEQDDEKGIVQVPVHAREDLNDVSQGHAHAREEDPKLEPGASSLEGDCEMAVDNGEEENHGVNGSSDRMSHKMGMAANFTLPSLSASLKPKVQTRGANASKEMDSMVMRSKVFNSPVCSSGSQATPSPMSISSGGGLSSSDDKGGAADGQESASSFTAEAPPLVSISLDAEAPVVQQQIVDMYMKSMQQFTESLAKMKLPFDIEGNTQSSSERSSKSESEKNGVLLSGPVVKDGGHRVFYGSRAFF